MLIIPGRTMPNVKTGEILANIAAITGLGANFAQRVVARGIITLEDLELAAYDGRLERMPGVGPARVAQVRRRLDCHLNRRPFRPGQGAMEQPEIATLLIIDADYRRQVEQHSLPLVAPRRFNPGRKAWLPVWHTERDGWIFTVMYSNSACAYRTGKRRDWVVMVYKRGETEGECTAVTEYRGPMRGRRVVRGRESECQAYYARQRVSAEVCAWARELAQRLPGESSGRCYGSGRYPRR